MDDETLARQEDGRIGPGGRAARAGRPRGGRLRQQQTRARAPPVAASSTWSATRPPNPSTRKPWSPAFEKTSAGQGRQLQQLLRRLRRPEPRRRGRSAGLRRPLLAGRRHGTPGRRRGTRLQGLGKAALRRHRHRLGRRDRRPQGQPEGDPLLRRPAEQGRRHRHPQPVQLRLGPLEHHGRLRDRAQRGQVAGPGARSGQDACSKRPWHSRAAAATRSPPSPRARATSCSATRTRRSRPKTRAKTSNT